jgi:hypothetical protein
MNISQKKNRLAAAKQYAGSHINNLLTIIYSKGAGGAIRRF